MISSLELARLCGVSQGTVDRALHGRAGVSEKTRARILEAARAHGYQPNPEVRTLLTGESKVVGAVVPSLRSVFFMDLLAAARDALAARGHRLFVLPVDGEDDARAALLDCAARRMRGALLVPPRDDMPIPDALRVATLLSPASSPKVRLVAPDEERTGRTAVQYLARLGHERIVHLTYSRRALGIEARARGYEQEMQELGFPPSVLTHSTEDALVSAIEASRATALFCHNDWLGLAALRAVERMGKRVPEDVSVLGVDDSPTFTELFPGLTTLRYPLEQVAEVAAAYVVLGEEPGEIAPLQVVERSSVRRIG